MSNSNVIPKNKLQLMWVTSDSSYFTDHEEAQLHEDFLWIRSIITDSGASITPVALNKLAFHIIDNCDVREKLGSFKEPEKEGGQALDALEALTRVSEQEQKQETAISPMLKTLLDYEQKSQLP